MKYFYFQILHLRFAVRELFKDLLDRDWIGHWDPAIYRSMNLARRPKLNFTFTLGKLKYYIYRRLEGSMNLNICVFNSKTIILHLLTVKGFGYNCTI